MAATGYGFVASVNFFFWIPVVFHEKLCIRSYRLGAYGSSPFSWLRGAVRSEKPGGCLIGVFRVDSWAFFHACCWSLAEELLAE